MNYFHLYKDIETLTISELIKNLNAMDKLPLRDVKFRDILFNVESLVGVYIFFDENNVPMYVGKTEGRSFLERLAAHFDLRKQGYMNHFLKALTGKPTGKDSSIENQDIQQAYEKLINFGIVFVSLHQKEQIRKVEIVLRQELKPLYNKHNSKIRIDPNEVLKNL